jgi:transposase
MHTKEGQNREELVMLSYDMLIALNNPVRLIDLICRKFISDNPWRDEWKGRNGKGCKSYPPGALLSLLVYGYFNKINSGRNLEKEAYRNIEVIWLLEGLRPDHWTICAFRRENKTLVKDLLKSFRAFLLDEKYASAKRLVFDGSKLKANASRNMLTKSGMVKKLENLDKSIAEYLSQLENNDNQDDELETARDEIEKLKAKVDELERQRSKIEAAKEIFENSGQQQISLNDKDAVLVKGRDGKFAGYNGQSGVGSHGHFIMYNEIRTEAVDQQQLENCVDKAQEEMGEKVEEAVADKGYGNTTQILGIENKGTQCFVPLATSSREKEENKGFVFTYDKSSDTYTCPQEKKLVLQQKNYKHRGAIYNVYKCRDCEGCPIRDECTKSKTGRTYKRNVHQEKIDNYKQKLETEYAKKRIAERKGVVEHPFGTIKWMMGKFNFLLTGKEKVQTEFNLYTTAYNIKRLVNCAPFSKLMEQINQYDWAIA